MQLEISHKGAEANPYESFSRIRYSSWTVTSKTDDLWHQMKPGESEKLSQTKFFQLWRKQIS